MTPADMARHIPNGSEPLVSMLDIERAHRGHWFDPDTLRFFGCRLPRYGYALPNGGAAFVSSEQQPPSYEPSYRTHPRAYTVRIQGPAGDFGPSPDLPGLGFQHFETRAQADTFARRFCRIAWTDPRGWAADMSYQRSAKHWTDKLIGAAFGISYQRAGAIMREYARGSGLTS